MTGSKIPLLLFKLKKPIRTMNVEGVVTYNNFFTKLQKGLFITLPNIFILKGIKLNKDLSTRQYNAISKINDVEFVGVVNCNCEASAILSYLLLRTLYDHRTAVKLYSNTKCVKFVDTKAINDFENRLSFILKSVSQYYSKSVVKMIVDKDALPVKKMIKLFELMDFSRVKVINGTVLVPIKNIPDYTGDLRMFIEAVKIKKLKSYLSFLQLDYFSKTYIYSHSFNSDYGGDQIIEVSYQPDGVILNVTALGDSIPYLKKYKVRPLGDTKRVLTTPVNALFLNQRGLYLLESHYFYSKSVRFSSRVFRSLKFDSNYVYLQDGEYLKVLSIVPDYTYSPIIHNVKGINFVR